MERATRDEVQRHADELSAKVTELTHQLEFLNSRDAAPGPGRAAAGNRQGVSAGCSAGKKACPSR